MSHEDLLDHLRTQPFLPFRIQVSDGSSYDIRHPEQAMPTFASVLISLPSTDPSNPVWNRPVRVSLFHVVRLEPLAPNPPPTSG
jgi:hypothetical protein